MPAEPDSIYNDQDKKYQWKTRGENCPYCQIMEGRVYILDVLITSSVYPGFHLGCNCYLVEVPQETPQSDLDIFGSAFNMKNEGWIEALFGNFDRLWEPGYFTNAQNIFNFSKPGMTAGQALKLYNQSINYGMFEDQGFPANIHYPWNVHRSVNRRTHVSNSALYPDIYTGLQQLIDGQYLNTVLSGKSGMFPTVKNIKPITPFQTYHNPLYNLGGGKYR